jgi:hypothetical protein
MSRVFKRGCLIVCLLLAAAVFYSAYVVFSFQHYYGEAEPIADRLHRFVPLMYHREKEGEPLPKTLSEFLALMPEEDQKRFEGYEMSWNPDADPRFKMRVNRKYGFIINQERFLWVTKPEELDALFPTS